MLGSSLHSQALCKLTAAASSIQRWLLEREKKAKARQLATMVFAELLGVSDAQESVATMPEVCPTHWISIPARLRVRARRSGRHRPTRALQQTAAALLGRALDGP